MSKGSIIPIESARQVTCQTPSFIDPRTVVDSSLSLKEGSSPLSSPTTSSHNSRSTSETPGLIEFSSREDFSASHNSFGFPVHPLNYFSSEAHHCADNPYSPPYQNLNVTMENNKRYLSGSEFSTSPQELSAVADESSLAPASPVRRRGPGRPSKTQSSAQSSNIKRPTGHSAVKLRRQMHNDSAMRSRARLNKALDDLWKVIPTQHKICQADNYGDDNKEVCRAVKVEVAIGYLKKLQAQLSGSQDGISVRR